MKFSRLLIPALVVAVLSTSMVPVFSVDQSTHQNAAHRVVLSDRQAGELEGSTWKEQKNDKLDIAAQAIIKASRSRH